MDGTIDRYRSRGGPGRQGGGYFRSRRSIDTFLYSPVIQSFLRKVSIGKGEGFFFHCQIALGCDFRSCAVILRNRPGAAAVAA